MRRETAQARTYLINTFLFLLYSSTSSMTNNDLKIRVNKDKHLLIYSGKSTIPSILHIELIKGDVSISRISIDRNHYNPERRSYPSISGYASHQIFMKKLFECLGHNQKQVELFIDELRIALI